VNVSSSRPGRYNGGVLDGKSREELEELYRQAPLGPAPEGLYRGHFLCWLPAARQWRVRLMDEILFRRLRFGIDFRRRLWWFVRPALAAGRFSISEGPSRWRDTQTLCLDYATSRLPGHGWLYDEVKPLDADHCLGLGGLNGPRDEGDHFFFSLTRV
jgi:hypothetical protein